MFQITVDAKEVVEVVVHVKRTSLPQRWARVGWVAFICEHITVSQNPCKVFTGTARSSTLPNKVSWFVWSSFHHDKVSISLLFQENPELSVNNRLTANDV
jgi:hypothetical protein